MRLLQPAEFGYQLPAGDSKEPGFHANNMSFLSVFILYPLCNEKHDARGGGDQ